MISPLSRRDRRQPWFVLALVVSLLFTQWLGFGHAIAHGNGLPEFSQANAQASSLPFHQKSSGNCAAIDAAALGTGVPLADVVIAVPTRADAPIALPLRTGRQRVFIAHFSSRAPPLNA